jgi:hypothetical protein
LHLQFATPALTTKMMKTTLAIFPSLHQCQVCARVHTCKQAKELTKHCPDKAADNDNKVSNLSDSDKGKDEEARTCRYLRTPMMVRMGAMAMMVEVMVLKVVGMAISQQGTEE